MNYEVINKVKKIIEDVKLNGDNALIKYTRIFDGLNYFSQKHIKLEIKNKPELEDIDFIKSLNFAIKNITKFHKEEYKNIKKFWIKKNKQYYVGQKLVPIESVGIYIPGGRKNFNYISSLLMTIIPAKIAKVKKIIVVTPPNNITKYFIYTLYSLGIKEVYRIGGAQAIAALAFGTKTVPKVDFIVGPGNIWVVEAKRQLVGFVGIDLLAGPSEVVVVADRYSNFKDITYELFSQAEHDRYARSYFIALDKIILNKVKNFIIDTQKDFLNQIEIIYETNLKKVCELINKIAPEHLTLLLKKPSFILKNVNNAAAVFYGKNPSAVLGDYVAGPSHVLPTNAASKFSSGLCVSTFLKKISIVKFLKKSTKELAKHAVKLASIEGMYWHKKRVEDICNL